MFADIFSILGPSWKEKQKKYAWALGLKRTVDVSIDDIRSRLVEIRHDSAAAIDLLAERLDACKGNTFDGVSHARDSKEAVEFIAQISKDTPNLCINRSGTVKELTNGLRTAGFSIIDSYYDEYDASKCQALQEASTLPPGILWSSFARETYPFRPTGVFKDFTGILGVSAISADGFPVFVQHLKNITRILQEAKRIILIVGLDKLVEKREDAEFQARCTAVFGLESIIRDMSESRVERRTEAGRILEFPLSTGKREVYVVILDNGRREILGSSLRDLHYCINCRACATVCPAYPYFRGELLRSPKEYLLDYVKGREASTDDCIQCGRCSLVCPVLKLNEVVSEAKARKVEEAGLPFRQRLFNGMILSMGMGRQFPSLANLVVRNRGIRKAVEKIVGFDSSFVLPSFSSKPSTPSRGTGRAGLKKLGRVAYYVGCFEEYFEGRSAEAIVEVLERCGFEVVIPKHKCCGLPHIAAGDLNLGLKLARFNSTHLGEALEQGCEAVIFSCPSCGTALKRDYHRLLGKEADALAGKVYDIFEFLLQGYRNGRCNLRFKTVAKKVAFQVPCHLQLQQFGMPAGELISLIPGVEVKKLDKHCCGMAGSYGLKHQNVERSLAIGNRLFEEIKKTSFDILATACPGCRIQIERGTGVKVVHPICLLQEWLA